MTAPNPSDSPCATSRDEQRGWRDSVGIHEAQTAPRFPLVEAMGVPVRGNFGSEFVNAHDLEAALAAAPVVYGDGADEATSWVHSGPDKPDTHSACLVCVQPIVRDTAELIVKDLADYARRVDADEYFDRAAEWSELKARASKLLGKG